jgi:hypothetical protein
LDICLAKDPSEEFETDDITIILIVFSYWT